MSKKGTFTLKNVDVSGIIKEYLEPIQKPKSRKGKIKETLLRLENETEIELSQIQNEKSERALYFLDFHKNPIKMWKLMYDEYNSSILPLYTAKNCWWCKHPFSTTPIGCPLRYHKKIESVHVKKQVQSYYEEHNISSEIEDIFETEGIFCSFPCVQAYILDESNSSRYKNSSTLLTLLFQKIYGKLTKIPIAPSWKQLIAFGGHMKLEEFRSSYGRLFYSEMPNIKRPFMFCSSGYIKERMK